MDPGICYIKDQFCIQKVNDNQKSFESENGNNSKRGNDSDNKSGQRVKIQKLNNDGNKNKGQNKNRPIFKDDKSACLCKSKINGPNNAEECTYSGCKYLHNIEDYMKMKPANIGEKCYIYSTKGFCPRGLTCRFAPNHVDDNFNNLKSNLYDETSRLTTFNGITTELQIRLRKFDYDFKLTKQIVERHDRERSDRIKAKVENSDECKKDVIDDNLSKESLVYNKEIGAVINDKDNVPKKVDFYNKIILSPLTTVGNLPFRRICKEYGADITCGEMACSVPLVKGLSQEWALTKRHESENVFGVQLCGNKATLIAQAAQLINDNCKVDFIDLNIGCPIDLIYKQGGGSALIGREKVLELVTRSCTEILRDTPFTVKTRTGIYANKSVAHTLMPKLAEWGASAITLHGRSREQRYTKNANWKYIEECASQVKNIPIIGNGDIMNYEEFNCKMEAAPHVSAVMIGRGALIKPWIFKEIKEQKHYDPSSSERFAMLQKYVNYGLEHWGSDTKGVETTRRFLLEWMSFLYRYVPFGLLKNPPQGINQRPEKYTGRNEMESLMSSGNCLDWIKISEMLLGPVPEGFTFLPKHKANSYNS